MRNQLLAEHLALVGPLEALLHRQSQTRRHAAHDHPPFVVEVAHDDLETQVLLPKQVLNRHLHVLEDDIRSTRRSRVRSLDQLSSHP